MIKCSFSNSSNRDQFLTASGLAVSEDGSVIIPMSLIPLAKNFNGTVSQEGNTAHRYLIKTDNINSLSTPITVITSEGNNGNVTANSETYTIIETDQGLSLYDELNGGVEQLDVSVKMLSELSGHISEELPEDAEWPRLRMISRSRPFSTEFTLAEVNYARKPIVVIMDSGINFDHDEFDGIEAEDLYALPFFNNNFRDYAGHGTAVASFTCGKNIGVHRHLTLLNCKIFSIDFKPNALEIGQALDAVYNKFLEDPSRPMVVNCSWTVAKSSYLEGKFQDLISAGIVVVAAAGNTGINCDFLTPAGMIDVITVGASDKDDVGAGFNNFSKIDFEITSNTGTVIDIFAPGVDCVGAHYSSNSRYCKFSGTSVSAGFTTGAIAGILALKANCFREDAHKILLSYASQGVLLLSDNFTFTQNKLVYLLTAENPLAFESSSFYLGAFTDDTLVISGHIGLVLYTREYRSSTNDEFDFIPIWDNVDLSSVFTIDEDGLFSFTNPELEWNDDEKIRLVNFKVKAVSRSNEITLTSPNLIFFASNPNVTSSLTGDISTALENIDNQSFFAQWIKNQYIK